MASNKSKTPGPIQVVVVLMLTVLAFYFGNRFGQVFDFNTMEITDGALATVNSIVAAPAAISIADPEADPSKVEKPFVIKGLSTEKVDVGEMKNLTRYNCAYESDDWVKNIPIIGGVVDFASDPGGWITDRFAEGAEFFFNDGLQNIKTTSTKSILGKSFNNLLGKKTGTFYSTVSFVNKSVVMPTAASILSLVMLIQLIKISQRIDGTATLPAIKDIVFLIIYATIFIWLLKNSLKICAGAYDLFNEMIGKINQSTVDELKTVTIADSCKESFGAVIGIWVQSMIFDLITIIIKGSVSVMCYMRAMQLYVMAAFSPLPFALLGFDETKNYGVSFCKNFLATCLAGVIILFAMGLFPNLLSGFSGGEISGFKGDMWSSVCASVALMLIVIKSGTIARDVFGG